MSVKFAKLSASEIIKSILRHLVGFRIGVNN